MPSGVEEEQQTRFPVTEKIAGAAPVNPAIFMLDFILGTLYDVRYDYFKVV